MTRTFCMNTLFVFFPRVRRGGDARVLAAQGVVVSARVPRFRFRSGSFSVGRTRGPWRKTKNGALAGTEPGRSRGRRQGGAQRGIILSAVPQAETRSRRVRVVRGGFRRRRAPRARAARLVVTSAHTRRSVASTAVVVAHDVARPGPRPVSAISDVHIVRASPPGARAATRAAAPAPAAAPPAGGPGDARVGRHRPPGDGRPAEAARLELTQSSDGMCVRHEMESTKRTRPHSLHTRRGSLSNTGTLDDSRKTRINTS